MDPGKIDAPAAGRVRRFTLVRKLGVVLIALLLVLAATGTILHRALLAVEEAMYQAAEWTVPMTGTAYEMEINVVESGLKVLKYLSIPNPEFRAGALKDMGDFDAFHQRYVQLARTHEDRKFGEQARALFDGYRSLALSLMNGADIRRAQLGLLARALPLTARERALTDKIGAHWRAREMTSKSKPENMKAVIGDW